MHKKRKQLTKKSMARQIAGNTTVALILILAAVVTFTLVNVMNVLSALKLREINSQTENAVHLVENYFTPYYAANEFLASNHSILEAFEEGMQKGESYRYETAKGYDHLLELMYQQQIALGPDAQATWICGFGNNEMLASSGWRTDPGFDPTSRPWYAELVAGKGTDSVVSSAYVDAEIGEVVVSVMKGVYSDDGTLIGVVAVDVFLSGLQRTLGAISIGDTGTLVVADSAGSIIFTPHADHVMKNVHDHDYPDNMQAAIDSGKNVPSSEKYIDGDEEFYSAIYCSDVIGWQLIGTMPNDEFMQEAWDVGAPMFWSVILSIIAACIVCIGSVKMMIKPIIRLADETSRMAAGDLNVDVAIKSETEAGLLAKNIAALSARLQKYIDYINEASRVLTRMGDGDLRMNLEQDYEGEFSQLKEALVSIQTSLCETISQISVSASQVDNGTMQISNAAQTLAQGTTEQASAVEELSATVVGLAGRANDGAEIAKNLQCTFDGINSTLIEGTSQMGELLAAMDDISVKSDEIGKIVKTISDIAFQTNILALNAAVEAARAGQAGKGFSVVADEVRSLASKCDEATNMVTGLVNGSTAAVSRGIVLARGTADTLSNTAATMGAASESMSDLAQRYKDEASTLNQVANGVEQISAVVQANSATAEQTAAGSEELSAQAQALHTLTGQFTMQ